VLENADRVAQTYVDEHRKRLGEDNVAMAGDLSTRSPPRRRRSALGQSYFASQVFYRSLDQAAMIQVTPDGRPAVDLGRRTSIAARSTSATPIPGPCATDGRHMCACCTDHSNPRYASIRSAHLSLDSRKADPLVLAQAARANSALGDYRRCSIDRAPAVAVQRRAVCGLAADRRASHLDRARGRRSPGAPDRRAGRRGAARRGRRSSPRACPIQTSDDEVGTLAARLQPHDRRLQEQTGALESRRALIEAVLSGVPPASSRSPRADPLINRPRDAAAHRATTSLVGRRSHRSRPSSTPARRGEREAVVQMDVGGEARTLAVKIGATAKARS
jgi:two-component system nitrogen regulation sensor histidine kinase NtrY